MRLTKNILDGLIEAMKFFLFRKRWKFKREEIIPCMLEVGRKRGTLWKNAALNSACLCYFIICGYHFIPSQIFLLAKAKEVASHPFSFSYREQPQSHNHSK